MLTGLNQRVTSLILTRVSRNKTVNISLTKFDFLYQIFSLKTYVDIFNLHYTCQFIFKMFLKYSLIEVTKN